MLLSTRTQPFQPLLSAKIETSEDFNKLIFPVLVSPKIDGIRICLHPSLGPVTRKLKPLPNEYVRTQLLWLMQSNYELVGLDGELTLGTQKNITDPDIFNKTQSAVMSQGGKPQCLYTVFDNFTKPDLPYHMRFNSASHWGAIYETLQIEALQSHIAESVEHILEFEHIALGTGFEGIMIRSPNAPYKYGRSTLNQNVLIKLKREEHGEVQEDEAIIEGFEELLHNDNEATIDERGYTKRSSHKANKRPGQTLGKFICRAITGKFASTGFKIGTGEGLTQELRQRIWNNQIDYKGKVITFSHQLRGAKDAPRFPIFKRFRAD